MFQHKNYLLLNLQFVRDNVDQFVYNYIFDYIIYTNMNNCLAIYYDALFI